MVKRQPRNKSKPKIEFSKKWLITCVVISIFYTLLSYLLAWFDKQTVESLSIAIIEAIWGASGISFLGYVLQNCCRAYTASKFGIPQTKTEDEYNSEEEQEEVIE